MAYKDVTPPAGGKISIQNGKLTVPENPILPFIRGDGTGPDIWAASVRVLDAAVGPWPAGLRRHRVVRPVNDPANALMGYNRRSTTVASEPGRTERVAHDRHGNLQTPSR